MTAAGLHLVEELILGESEAVCQVRELVARVAPTTLPVLIQGPTGVGKDLVAQALHAASARRGQFVAFNVAAISESMFEDALFGHVRGAFTGAVTDARGYLAEADGGTVFFDEIGTLPLGAQAKLLRALEARRFRPVGARDDRRSEFRVVAATNERMDALVRTGRFREDLAYRLNAVVVRVPPLRERPEDIPVLARRFAATDGGVAGRTFSDAAMSLLEQQDWPGNVRQLRNVVECAATLSREPLISRESVSLVLNGDLRAAAEPTHESGSTRLAARALTEVLERFGWDTARAAEHLGVHRATVYRRMLRLRVRVPDDCPIGGARADIPRAPFAAVRADANGGTANSRELDSHVKVQVVS